MDHHRQHVGVDIRADEFGPDRRRGAQIESFDAQCCLPLGQLIACRFGDRQLEPRGFEHLDLWPAVVLGIDRAQRFMAGDHVGECEFERCHIQGATQGDGEGDVVRAGFGFESIEEPES